MNNPLKPEPQRPDRPYRPEWHESAACASTDPEIFFSNSRHEIALAREICAGCSVRLECATATREQGERYGVWAGVDLTSRSEARSR